MRYRNEEDSDEMNPFKQRGGPYYDPYYDSYWEAKDKKRREKELSIWGPEESDINYFIKEETPVATVDCQ
jgi:hypothetical protein